MKGIPFTQDNIRLVRERKKTQTRRVEASLKEINKNPDDWVFSKIASAATLAEQAKVGMFKFVNSRDGSLVWLGPRYLPGETVYVKEAHFIGGIKPNEWVRFKDSLPESKVKDYVWRSPMFLPGKFARTFLHIKDVRPERLQDITEEDAKAEGAQCVDLNGGYRVGYAQLWDSINKPPHDWAANDWVWAYSFSLTEAQKCV